MRWCVALKRLGENTKLGSASRFIFPQGIQSQGIIIRTTGVSRTERELSRDLWPSRLLYPSTATSIYVYMGICVVSTLYTMYTERMKKRKIVSIPLHIFYLHSLSLYTFQINLKSSQLKFQLLVLILLFY